MYAVMWSEHCSYKSSRIHLRRLPTEAEWVLVGPGENAGVVDVGDGIAAALRIESHNHPSAIEPYQGAATGVGGILRDIFTMGARPIALMDPLRFGPLDDARSRWIAEGVVSGDLGLRQLGGRAHRRRRDRVRRDLRREPAGQRALPGHAARPIGWCSGRPPAWATWPCCSGSTTGRDGIGGVSVLASAGFSDDAEPTRPSGPSVQVGDPYEEKRLIEACLALLDAGLVVGIQDLGGAGLTCATSETASRGGVGMDVDVTAIPRREPGMEPFEVLTSESQERMLAIVEPDDLDQVLAICAALGRAGRRSSAGSPPGPDGSGPRAAAACASSTAGTARCWPTCRRPRCTRTRRSTTGRIQARRRVGRRPRARWPARRCPTRRTIPGATCSTCWWTPPGCGRQYDHQLFLNTVEGPGGDATVLRLQAPGDRGRHRPRPGPDHRRQPRLVRGRSAPGNGADGGRVGAQPGLRRGPAAGRRELPQLRQSRPIPRSCGSSPRPSTGWPTPAGPSACRSIGGNVSLYNESRGADIDPTPGHRDARAGRPPRPAAARRRAGRRGPPGAGRRRPSPS